MQFRYRPHVTHPHVKSICFRERNPSISREHLGLGGTIGLALGVLDRSASNPVPSSTGQSLLGFKMRAKGSCRRNPFRSRESASVYSDERACPRGRLWLSYNMQFVVQSGMPSTIQARLDDRSRKRLAALVRELGWTPSRVVREGLRILEVHYVCRKKQGVIGLGRFSSGVPDLGTNRKHLRGFGK